MANGSVVEVVGLAFSMIAIRLMMVLENTQVTIVGAIGQARAKRPKRVVALAMGAKKIFVLKVGIVFFGRISALIFQVQEMYAEKTVQAAASSMMNTIVVSNKMIGRAASRYTRHAARTVKKGVTHPYYRNRHSRSHPHHKSAVRP
ncbi:MAG TPA: hypothetical protein VGQ03_02030 [Nitrososphaera sp.]|jgi:hypothetical protein|nr:hypothetical protein [Nitrososphaera sp.]